MRRAAVFATAEAVEEAYYDALMRGDAKGLMSLWADDEDVVCLHPGGPRLVGIDAIRESYEQVLSKRGLRIRISDVRIHQGAVIAVHNVVEQVMVDFAEGGESFYCVATNIYVKTGNGWRMVMHHATTVSDANQTAGGAGGTAVLH